MRKIKWFVEKIDEEICGADEYMENYIEAKINGDSTASNSYKKMAMDEIDHSEKLHEMASAYISKLKSIYTPPPDMAEKWEESHMNYIKKVAWIKEMLSK